jgi:hypothetical protein
MLLGAQHRHVRRMHERPLDPQPGHQPSNRLRQGVMTRHFGLSPRELGPAAGATSFRLPIPSASWADLGFQSL